MFFKLSLNCIFNDKNIFIKIRKLFCIYYVYCISDTYNEIGAVLGYDQIL